MCDSLCMVPKLVEVETFDKVLDKQIIHEPDDTVEE